MHVTLLRISGTAGRIALKLGVWLGDHYLSVLQGMGRSVQVYKQLYKHLARLFVPARSSPKRYLTGVILGWARLGLVMLI